MEDVTSSGEKALLGKLRALARRGSFLQRSPGGGEIRSIDGRMRPGPRGMTRVDIDKAIAAGLIRSTVPGQYVLTRAGVQALRRDRAIDAVAAARRKDGPGLRHSVVEAAQPAVSAKPTINVSESPLGWLRQRKSHDGSPLISAIEFEAGERLRADFWFAQLAPRVTSSWDAMPGSGRQRLAPGTGRDIADTVIAARERVNRALAAVGPELSGILIDVCCFLKGLEQAEREARLPQRSGKVVLQYALRSLARHYGLERRGTPGVIRHWGEAGYRPGLEGSVGDQANSGATR